VDQAVVELLDYRTAYGAAGILGEIHFAVAELGVERLRSSGHRRCSSGEHVFVSRVSGWRSGRWWTVPEGFVKHDVRHFELRARVAS
jgi:hypothetical protein